ncbi:MULTISPECIES: hypothetical protein [unclassified Variovorax]|uniref:hypothetical protein n=1 Tax=unclassified Variovorax TaxID=663243 RepID=UPI00076D92B3|nr:MULTISPECIES: hypothetical protein [unclassified Variovorax]KWT98451.1 hypothetical protein APY03_0586 [Variovorax sp. WDL1]PNG49878.1 hypothetical protein CHC06_05459 [Variovorax sp. B2]PNG50750.1 hypothetical protein CHC07_05364 [Variovorax sp. B4]VTU42209.1 hypothetical protein H6P1_00130 [Variovorax sp. PBL-H6]VTU44167.1 hypothetical protein SRS16P1_00772 [Variovorax sp. SRS16]
MEIKNAVLVSLNISVWQANRQDKKISEQVTDAHQVTDRRLGRFWKSLLPKCQVLDTLYAAQRAARTFHYENTLAWMHDGPRILPTANYESYMKAMRGFKHQFEVAVLGLIDQYDGIREEARKVLGQLYSESDYPDKQSLKYKYDFDMKVMTMPASEGMLHLGLADKEAQDLCAKLEADMRDTFKRANRRMWEDLHERLERLSAKLMDGDAYVREETIAAVRDLADLLPRLNVTNDEKLDMLANRLKGSLTNVSAAMVKNDPSARKRVADEAKTVFSVMQAFMGQKRAPPAPMAAPAVNATVMELKRAA